MYSVRCCSFARAMQYFVCGSFAPTDPNLVPPSLVLCVVYLFFAAAAVTTRCVPFFAVIVYLSGLYFLSAAYAGRIIFCFG